MHGNCCCCCCLNYSHSNLHAAVCSQSVNSKRGSTSSCKGNGRNCSSPAEIVLTVLVSLSIVAGVLRPLNEGENVQRLWTIWDNFHQVVTPEGTPLAPGNDETRRVMTDDESHVASTAVGRFAQFSGRVHFALEPSSVVEESQECQTWSGWRAFRDDSRKLANQFLSLHVTLHDSGVCAKVSLVKTTTRGM